MDNNYFLFMNRADHFKCDCCLSTFATDWDDIKAGDLYKNGSLPVSVYFYCSKEKCQQAREHFVNSCIEKKD